jgi:hypothetical protein
VSPLWWIQDGQCACPKGAACASPGKHPLTPNGVKDATDDPVQLAAWREQYPFAHWAVATGARSGVIVIDLDRKPGKDGIALLAAMAKARGGLPRTRMVRTGSGGLHLYFKHPGGHVPNSAGKLGPGIDVRGDGGYVVAPGSGHISGGRYKLLNDIPPAELPAWLLAALRRAPISVQVQSPDAPKADFPPASPAVLEEARAALLKHGPAPERINGEGGGQHTVQAAAILTHDYALSDAEALPLFLEWNARNPTPWNTEIAGPEGLRERLRRGRKYGKAEYGCKRKPVIELVAGRLAEITTQAELALVNAGVQVFSRGGALVRPVVEEVDAAHGRRTEVARLARLDATYVRDLLSRHARFRRRGSKKDELVTADPPADVAQTLLSRVGEWRFPALAGVITTQTMRPDGTILDAPGFDPATRLVLMAPPSMPSIPDAPTRGHALDALDLLLELLAEFPFVDEASRSVALSATAPSQNNFSVWMDSVIPFSMEVGALKAHRSHLRVGNLCAKWVGMFVEFCTHMQPLSSRGSCNEVDNYLMTDERPAAPVLGDMTEHAMLNLVPLARARREMTDCDRQASVVGKLL